MKETRTIVAALAAAVALLLGFALGWAVKPQPGPDGNRDTLTPPGYRYVEEVARYYEPANPEGWTPTGAGRWEQHSERWVLTTLQDGIWSGEKGHLLHGDPRVVEGIDSFTGGREHYSFSVAMRPPLHELPTDAAATRALLVAAVEDRRWDWTGGQWASGHPTPAVLEYRFVEAAIALLADANITDAQRRALYGALTLSPDSQPAPGVEDVLGRHGDAVRIALQYPGSDHLTYTVSFDPDRAEMLFWSWALGEDGRSESHTLVRTGHVDWLGERP